ncbi:hypothetical protein M8C21_020976, partial [Ambrosia artemisiifolia]
FFFFFLCVCVQVDSGDSGGVPIVLWLKYYSSREGVMGGSCIGRDRRRSDE